MTRTGCGGRRLTAAEYAVGLLCVYMTVAICDNKC